jgi:glycosyltransferase involved in cell wall biosynthesis
MEERLDTLRIAFIVGGLGKGGAEKQFIYMLRAMKQQNVKLMVYTLTEGEFYERSLKEMDIEPVRVRAKNPIARTNHIVGSLRHFQPHFIQATHFYTSFYAGAAGKFGKATSIGAIRNDFYHDIASVGRLGSRLMNLPAVFLANSYNARNNAIAAGIKPDRLYVLPNVIDLNEFDQRKNNQPLPHLKHDCTRVIAVARLMPVKRLERFLVALALARQKVPTLQGLLVGSGPEEMHLKTVAQDLGLRPNAPDGGVQFLGTRDDIPELLHQSDIFLLTSDREGFPNVLLEAMAASLPIISTPAGEVKDLVIDGENGFLVPFEDVQSIADCLIRLSKFAELGRQIGSTGRAIVEEKYSFSHLAQNMEDIYRAIALQQKNKSALSILMDGQEVST